MSFLSRTPRTGCDGSSTLLPRLKTRIVCEKNSDQLRIDVGMLSKA